MFELKKIVADFRTSLSAKISVGGTTGTIQNNLDDDGVVLPAGKYCFTFDLDNSQKEHITCDLSGKNLTNIKSVSRQGVETTGVLREHRIGASVSLTDFAYIKHLNDALNGDIGLNPAKRIKYDSNPVFTDSKELITKQYADSIASSGIIAMLVSDAGGVKVDINSGTYILNGTIETYAGISGQSLTDNATNYIQILNGVLNIATDAFDDDAIPLATAVCLSGDITSLTDNRPFYTGMDLKADGGIGRDSNGIFIDLATSSGLNINGSNQLEVDLKDGGGIIKDADGLSLEELSSFVMPAFENISTGDLLKTFNDEGDYKLRKLIGINSASSSAVSKSGNIIRIQQISDTKIAFMTDTPKVYIADYDGSIISNLVEITASTGTLRDFCVASDNTIVVLSSSYNGGTHIVTVYARAYNISAGTYGSEISTNPVAFSVTGDCSDIKSVRLTDTLIQIFSVNSGASSYGSAGTFAISLSGTTLTAGTTVDYYPSSDSYYPQGSGIGKVLRVSDTLSAIVWYRGEKPSTAWYGGFGITMFSLSGTTITAGTFSSYLGMNSDRNLGWRSDAPLSIEQVDDDKFLIFHRDNDVTTSLWYCFATFSGTTISSYSTLTELPLYVNNDSFFTIKDDDGSIYLMRKSDKAIYRFMVDIENNKILPIYTSSYIIPDAYIPIKMSNYHPILFLSNDTAVKTQLSLLDHNDFVQISDDDYLAEASIFIKQFYNYTNLIQGALYYVGSDGQSITQLNTYQKKIGRAISDTIIIKE